MLDDGELVWVDFDPVRGSEQAGARPAVVISTRLFNEESRRAIVCPITSNTQPWPTKVMLPDDLPIGGAVLVDQVRAVDRASRGFRKLGRVPDDILITVRAMLSEFIGIGDEKAN